MVDVIDIIKAKSAIIIERLYPGLLSGMLRPQNDGMKMYLEFSGIRRADCSCQPSASLEKMFFCALCSLS